MIASRMTAAQFDTLRLADRMTRRGEVECSELVMERARAYVGGLAWRIADRTVGALFQRALIERDPACDDLIRVTGRGREALEAARIAP